MSYDKLATALAVVSMFLFFGGLLTGRWSIAGWAVVIFLIACVLAMT